MMISFAKIPRRENHRKEPDECRSFSRTGSPGKDTEKSFTRDYPYSTVMKRRGSNISSSEACSRESRDIYRLASWLARMLNLCARKSSTQALKSSSPLNTSAQPNKDAEKRSSFPKSLARDAPRGNTDISEQGTDHAPNHGQEVPRQGAESPSRGTPGDPVPKYGQEVSRQGAESPSRGMPSVPGVPKRGVNKLRGTDLATLSASKDDDLQCRYCGQTSRIGDFIDRVLTLRKPTQRGVPPSRTLTPLRCKTCYGAFPVSPQAQPRRPSVAQQEKEVVARGKMKILMSSSKPSALSRTLRIMMEEQRLQQEKDEDKKRERGTTHFVERDVLLLKLHMRRTVIGAGVPGYEVANYPWKSAEWPDPVYPLVNQNR